ncbi:response regulator transcription factor [Actinoallomurus spadix]|uniref:Response regulator transcription factor n=1 Tax=Actinoallomurus spadix TaxID=79912 RepID=A0ABN0WYA6_9ACTN|nr:response regulator transcription factor [Actinoallomurus spadix]MCO5989665.1 response regulator transcription factor [Actinoallomurus spadix]
MTDTPVRILIVEDDPGISASLQRGLTRAGYDASAVSTAAEALAAGPSDVVLLDLGLPDADGTELCGTLRRRSDSAILVITARGEEPDRVAALDAGADDYIVKPFGFAELMARIRAVLRRSRLTETHLLRHGSLTIDTRTRRVTSGGAEVSLTPTEFDILECLATDPGRVVSRQEILERVWNTHWYGPTRVLDVHIAALRRKLGDPSAIQTVYARGFRLGDPG